MARLSMAPQKLSRLTLLLLAVTAVIGIGARASEQPFRAHLIAPASEAALAAGSTATIAWNATGVPRNFDEWEAFLSLDGGRSYPIRITPHLDLAIRSFTWSVPNLPGGEGSILLRFGDEREEQRFAFGRRFRITGALNLVRPWRASVRARARGEAAVPDDEGVVAWIEGPRNGSSITQVTVDDETLSSGREVAVSAPTTSALLSAPSPRGDRGGLRSTAIGNPIARTRGRRVVQSRGNRSEDILLITRRRNI
jgi:hypothetical protein